ncbi:PKD domain-containing protein [Pedobacter sp. JY14-1]|uniref:PKD domain-containing protein n=1 Tax=Pedobacter sp. JY14-1 TaxID=3034151 RepID=UPI0023E1EC3D|nr:PKD domain-containing protein [Pedobacter sp. JY14-1]
MKKKISCLFLLALASTLATQAQNEINVDHLRGRASVSVPLASFKIKGFESKLSLDYNAQSVKVKQQSVSGDMPVGWNLQGTGEITRVLKGLPDEYQKSGDARKGWLNSGIQGLAQSFSVSDDNNPNTCTDEATNRNSILTNWGYTLDSEPDWFMVSAPGLSCKLVLDNTNTFRAIPAQDLKIEFLDQATANPYFVITNRDGVKYTFKSADVETRSVAKVYTNSSLDVFNRDYEYFKTAITYITTWHLDKITTYDSESNKITYEYSQATIDPASSQPTLSSYSTGTNTFSKVPLYTVSTSGSRKILNKITSTTLQQVSIGYTPTIFNVGNGAGNVSIQLVETQFSNRDFLTEVRETSNGCTSILYKFSYYNPSTLPATNSDKYDSWGYFNNLLTKRQLNVFPGLTGASGLYKPYPLSGYSGENYALNGSDPVIDETSLTAGVMSKVTYPTGGSSYFEYESNSFWDQDGNVEIKGSGIRLKKLTHFDGISPAKASVTEYAYNIPGQSRTSGTIKALPQVAATVNSFAHPNNSSATLTNAQVLAQVSQQSADYWKYLTVISDADQDNASDHSVIYQYVTEKETGNGKTEYKYNTPVNLWAAETNSLVYPAMACSGSKPAGLPVKKGYAQYPFPYKENQEYAEGLLLESKVFTESGKQVSASEYEYEDYTTSPQVIYGMGFDLLYGNLLFSRYGLTVNAKVLKREKETTFDTGTSTNTIFTEVNYDNSAPDKNVRSKTIINSDNTTLKTSYTYSGDFSIGAGQIAADSVAEGIYLLNQKYIKDVVLEELEQRQEPGASVFKVYGGKLFLYKKNALNGNPVVKEIKTLNSLTGLSGVSAVSFNGTSIVYHANYKTQQAFTYFNSYDAPQGITEKRVKSGLMYSSFLTVPSVVFTGAELANVAFTSFEGGISNFTESGFVPADYTTDAHTGILAGTLKTSNYLSRTFTKLTGSRTYNVNFWAKASAAGVVTVSLNNVAVATINVGVSSDYVFYQKHINVAAIPSSSTIKLSASSPVFVDDVAFSPEEINYQFIHYSYPFGKASETNSSGKTAYYEYDGKGRPTITRDASRNIVKVESYRNYNNIGTALSASFSMSGAQISVNTPMAFSTNNNCLTGVKYTWNFGDGTTAVETYDPQVSHTFAPGAASYTVTLTAYHPEFGTVTSSQSFQVKLLVSICVAGPMRKDICGINPTTMGDCTSGFPAPSSGSKVYVTGISGCASGATYQYQWEQRINGTNTWTSVGTNQNQHTVPYVEGLTELRCKVTASCGIVGYSGSVIVEFYKSGNCPNPHEE